MTRNSSSIQARPVTARGRLARRFSPRWPWAWRPDPAVPVLLLLPLLVFAAQATGRAVFSGHDIQYYFYPYHAVPARMIAEGHPPLWNPYAFSGIPLLGDGQTALFYPPNWLFLIPGLSPSLALNYAILTQFSIAGLGLYGFARTLGLRRLPAFVAAIAYTFGGFMTARVVHLSILSGAALLPVVFLCVERALRPGTRRWRWFALAAGAVALQAVTGHPQIPVYTALAVGLYTLARAVERLIETGGWRPLALFPIRLAGIYTLGYLLAAIQLLPWIELGRLSPRAVGASFAFVFDRSKEGSEWLLFLFPYLFGALRPGLYAPGGVDTFTAARIWEQSSYVGVLPLALAIVGLAGLFLRQRARGDARLRRTTCFFALLLAIGVLLAAGPHTPVGRLLYVVPVVGKLRDVERAIVLASFALALLAGLGLQRLIEPPAEAARGRQPGLLALAVVVLLAPLAVVAVAYQAALPAWLVAWGIVPQDLRLLRLDRANAIVPLLFAGASAAWLAWRGYGRATAIDLRPSTFRRSTPYASLVALALVVLDLTLFAATFHAEGDPLLYQRVPPVVDFLRQDDSLFRTATFLTNNRLDDRAAQERLAVSWGMVYGIADINGFNSLQPRRYTDFLFSPDQDDVSYGLLQDEWLLTDDSPVLSALNVKYLLMPKGVQPEAPVGAAFRPVWEDDAVRVYQNERVYPRAYFAATARHEPDSRAILRAVTAPGFDGRREALVERADPLPLPATPGIGAEDDHVSFASYAPDRFTLTTSTAAPRLLVLSEMDLPGWHATIDGVPTPIYRANYLFRGIIVPPGEHAVTLTYRPASLRWGAALSGAALAIVLVLVAWGGRGWRPVRVSKTGQTAAP